jgi:uncharacterized pyridoxamine 5'-phosphate oxidase family protein
MNNTQEFNQLMEKTANIALATSVNNIPNVRIVNFCYDVTKPGIVYFSTVRGNSKVAEFEKNDKVAFTTIPAEGFSHIRTTNAIVQKSRLSMDEVKELFLTQVPGFDETLSEIGGLLDVYEIHMKEAIIILGVDQTDVEISF